MSGVSRPIPGYPGYHITDGGVVYSARRGCMKQLKPDPHRQGYSRVTLQVDGKPCRVLVHRLVALAWIGAVPFEGANVLHKDDDRSNNHFSNLYYGTQSQNMKDAVNNGKITIIHTIYGTSLGSKNGNSKLSEVNVAEIKMMLRRGDSRIGIARLFEISLSAVELIRSGKTWRHVGQGVAMKGKKLQVHDHGHIILMDFMGDDHAICEAARTAYQKGTVSVSDDRTLIRYLMRNKHTSPFECCYLKFHIKLPIFVERQWARHRTAGWNEVSARYSELPEEYFVPDASSIRAQSTVNKQGRDGELDQSVVDSFVQHASSNAAAEFVEYHRRLESGVARELARINLPLSTYTEKVWWINLHNLLHFLALRMDSHAQLEIRQYATIIGEQIVRPLFPLVWEAFEDYRLQAMTLTRLEIEAVQLLVRDSRPGSVWQWLDENLPNKRERDELIDKLNRLGLWRVAAKDVE